MNTALFNSLLNKLEQSPDFEEIKQNEVRWNMYQTLKAGDSQKGEALARNICSSYGMSEREMYNRVRAYFHL